MENKVDDFRTRNIFLAKLAEQAERYEEMIRIMKELVTEGTSLSTEERNLLSVGYKNVVGARRASWRIVTSILSKEKHDEIRSEDINKYRATIESELEHFCSEILELIDQYLLPAAAQGEPMVFYYKMKGDYNRYLAEFMSGDAREKVSHDAESSYEQATELAEKFLEPANVIRLGLALNYSVFYYEIRNSTKLACNKAKSALENAVNTFDNLAESSFKESGMILLLLRDNLELWAADTYEEPPKAIVNEPPKN